MRIAVVGGGIAGCAAALAAACAGHSVCVFSRGEVAHDAAAGMLAPWSEAKYTEPDLLRIGVDSVAEYPHFVERINAHAHVEQQVALRETGTVIAAYDVDDAAALRDQLGCHQRAGRSTAVQPTRLARVHEPGLSTRLRGAAVIPEDTQVDPGQLYRGLRSALAARGVQWADAQVDAVTEDGEVLCARQWDGGERFDLVIVAAGARTSELVAGMPVRAVAGTTLRLRPRTGAPVPVGMTVRAIVAGRPLYIVPTVSGDIVLGATEQERGLSRHATVEELFELTRAARAVVPEVADCEVLAVNHRWRPTTPDHLPVMGVVQGRVAVCSGHYRGGVLLAAWTHRWWERFFDAGGAPDPADSDVALTRPLRFAGAGEVAPTRRAGG